MEKKPNKIVVFIGAIIIVIVGKVVFGYFFGLTGSFIGALGGAALAGYVLKYYGAVSENSSLVTETKGVQKAKYILLAVVLIVLGIFAYFVLNQ